MENLSARLKQMETDIFNLKRDVVISKMEIVRLEEKLTNSEQKIAALEQESKVTKPSATSAKCRCGLKKEEAEKIIQKVSAVEQKCENLTKLQGILNIFLLRAQRKSQDGKQIENLQAQFIALSQDVTDLQSNMTLMDEAKTEILEIPAEVPELDDKHSNTWTSFEKCLELVRDHKLPLSVTDYWDLYHMESIANEAEGPAARLCGNHIPDFVLKKSKQRMRKRYITMEAMSNYIHICSRAAKTFGRALTPFFYAVQEFTDGHGDCILAISRTHLTILSSSTKKEIGSWPLTAIRKCEEKTTTELALVFCPRKKSIWKLYCIGHAHEVCALIKRLQNESSKAEDMSD